MTEKETTAQAPAGKTAQGSAGKATAWQATKFTLFSASAGIIQLGLTELLLKAFHLDYAIAYAIGLVASVLWNFTFNRRYTFRSDMNIPRAMGLVALFYAVFLPVTTWAGAALTSRGVNEDIVLIGTMLLNFVLEFLYQRFVVYRNTIDTNDLAKKAAEKETLQ